jgi:hypothetical protein
MHFKRSTLAAWLAVAAATTAQATAVALPTDGSWAQFDVDDLLAQSGTAEWIDINDGSSLSFQFTVPIGLTGKLTVVDAVDAGDTFDVFANGALLGPTSPAGTPTANVGYDFTAALADPAFSRGVFWLAPGIYAITGNLASNVSGFNATAGGLNVSLVPEPATAASVLAGLAALAAVRRRRAP